MKWQKLQRVIFIIFVALIIGSLVIYEIFGADFELNQIREYLARFGIWAPLVFILIYILGTIFIPSTPFMAISGVLFGFKYGLIYTIIGGFFSSVLVFIIARKLGKERVDDILKNSNLKFLAKYNKRLENGGIWDLLILRITPIMPFNILNLLMGISRIKTRGYVIGTMLGLIPSNILTVYFGSFVSTIF